MGPVDQVAGTCHVSDNTVLLNICPKSDCGYNDAQCVLYRKVHLDWLDGIQVSSFQTR